MSETSSLIDVELPGPGAARGDVIRALEGLLSGERLAYPTTIKFDPQTQELVCLVGGFGSAPRTEHRVSVQRAIEAIQKVRPALRLVLEGGAQITEVAA